MYSYTEFARRGRGRDKKPRKRRIIRNAAIAAGGLGLLAAGGYGAMKFRDARKAAKAIKDVASAAPTPAPVSALRPRRVNTVRNSPTSGPIVTPAPSPKPGKRRGPRRPPKVPDDQRDFSSTFMGDYAEFRRGKDKMPRKRRAIFQPKTYGQGIRSDAATGAKYLGGLGAGIGAIGGGIAGSSLGFGRGPKGVALGAAGGAALGGLSYGLQGGAAGAAVGALRHRGLRKRRPARR